MFILGVCGGVASGKSTVAAEWERQGAVVLNADALGHEVLTEPEIKAQLQARWGPAVFLPDGAVNRPAIAALVFGHSPQANLERAFLNQLTHPRIRAKLQQRLSELPPMAIVVLDAALLFESGWYELCQGIVFVDTPREQRLARAAERGWQAEAFAAREAAQWPVEEKKRRSHWVLPNHGTPTELRAAAAKCFEGIKLAATSLNSTNSE